MKIKVELTEAELKEMMCDSLHEFEEQLRHQIDNGVSDDEGCAGVDWIAEYDLEITLK